MRTATPRRTTTTGLALAAMALLVSGCGADPEAESADEPTAAATTALQASAGLGRCMAPTAELLRTQDTAFEGTVTSLDEGTATLRVDHWFAGEETPTVSVQTPSRDLGDLLLAVEFEEGGTYLVSAADGRVAVCGLSAVKDERLSGLYTEAFGG